MTPMVLRRAQLSFLAAAFLLLPCCPASGGQENGNAAAIKAVQDFLIHETRELGARAKIAVDAPPPGTSLSPCARHEVFLPAASRLWGKTTVGVRCNAPNEWTAYLPVTVTVHGKYVVSARKINRGQTITASDVELLEGDLTQLPATILNELQQAIGQQTKVGLAGKQVLRREHLLRQAVIKQGDKVKIVVRGSVFAVTSEGVALQDAADGESIKVRNSNGKTLSGVARPLGEVELAP